jgi:RNA polymerase sigma-70 factor (ECF subfamily)
MDEMRWIQLARAGDQEAFCHLYGIYKNRLYRYAYYRLGNREDAEDAVSDCVLSAWRQISGLRTDKAFPAWIFRILSGCCNTIIRNTIAGREAKAAAAARYTSRCAPPASTGDGGSSDRIVAAAPPTDQPSTLRLELEEALEQLTEQEREIVLMAVVGGLKSPEIAEATGLTAGSVRSKLSRSLSKMRRYLEE